MVVNDDEVKHFVCLRGEDSVCILYTCVKMDNNIYYKKNCIY